MKAPSRHVTLVSCLAPTFHNPLQVANLVVEGAVERVIVGEQFGDIALGTQVRPAALQATQGPQAARECGSANTRLSAVHPSPPSWLSAREAPGSSSDTCSRCGAF
jgi:hypothetical protein